MIPDTAGTRRRAVQAGRPAPRFAAAGATAFALIVAPLLLLGASAPGPRNLILMVPDGSGPAAFALARMLRGQPLSLDSLLTGGVGTASLNSRVTDSAAAATAYATGMRTRNRMLSIDSGGVARRTLFEAAAAAGLATGLVVKCRVTDATPAAFIAHATERSRETDIALDELAHRPDVLLGGGRDRFLPASQGGRRDDDRDLVEEARRAGWQVATSREELDGPLRTPLLGLFARGDLGYAIDADPAVPGLPAMVRRALSLLGGGPRGFVLLVEGSLIDHGAHENDPATVAREALEFDDAVAEVIAFARRDAHTLVVCAADHETGGLTLGRRSGGGGPSDLAPESLLAVTSSAARMQDSVRGGTAAVPLFERLTGLHLTPAERETLQAAAGRGKASESFADLESAHARLSWATGGHTAADVGLFAFGPGSERFRGRLANDDVGRRLAASLRLSVGEALPAGAQGGAGR